MGTVASLILEISASATAVKSSKVAVKHWRVILL